VTRLFGRPAGEPGEVLAGEKPRWGMDYGKEKLMRTIVNFLKSEDGPTATEYAVMLALIIIVAMAGITLLGTKVNAIFTNVEGGLPSGS